LRRNESLSFFALLTQCEPLEVVVTFLAALELVRAHKIVYQQVAPFGDILFKLAPKESAVKLAQSA
jgi:chromatin segregation and condensation protein Rec8/ScpA/Scc1 (kleisin family)